MFAARFGSRLPPHKATAVAKAVVIAACLLPGAAWAAGGAANPGSAIRPGPADMRLTDAGRVVTAATPVARGGGIGAVMRPRSATPPPGPTDIRITDPAYLSRPLPHQAKAFNGAGHAQGNTADAAPVKAQANAPDFLPTDDRPTDDLPTGDHPIEALAVVRPGPADNRFTALAQSGWRAPAIGAIAVPAAPRHRIIVAWAEELGDLLARASVFSATISARLHTAAFPATGRIGPTEAIIVSATDHPQARTVRPGPSDLRVTDHGLVMAIRSKPLFTVAEIDATERAPNFAQNSLRCLATAIYFESRGEPIAGQYAVAHVIANRVRNRYYPDTVCEVVFQNWHRPNRCQFSFACDGKPEIARNTAAWARSLTVARRVLTEGSGPVATPIRRSTHFHATYVRPFWSQKLRQTGALGRHIFYVTYRK